MLAGRLALAWGIVDVRAWLASLPRGALNFWEAFDAVEPIGEQWGQTSLLAWAATIENFREPKEPEDFMPARFRRKKRRLEIPTKEDSKLQFESFIGLFGFSPDGNNNQRG